jgi:signal transduction histidine kinase
LEIPGLWGCGAFALDRCNHAAPNDARIWTSILFSMVLPDTNSEGDMPKPDFTKLLDKLAHDLRNPVHSAQLNLQAAQMLAAKWQDANGQRLGKHLSIIAAELENLKKMVAEAAQQLKD